MNTTTVSFDPAPLIATELELPAPRVAATMRLLADGNTVPFVARYRKEVTGGLDEVAIRSIQERGAYLADLEQRRRTVLASIEEQGKLTAELRRQIAACTTKAALEDLYLPFRPRRRTRATIARERGLEPLAARLWTLPDAGDPEACAARCVDPERGVADHAAALQGARDIVAEWVSEQAAVRTLVRRTMQERGQLVATADPARTTRPTKFEQYYDHRERLRGMPSHRFLAMRRGEREGVLHLRVEVDEERLQAAILELLHFRPRSPFAAHFEVAVVDALGRLLLPSVETEVRAEAKLAADREAVEVFAENLENLLLAPPLGARPVVGIDPGIRTGSKCASVDASGRYLDHITIFAGQGRERQAAARCDLAAFIARQRPAAIAIGNGTGGRETEALVRRLLREEVTGEPAFDGIVVVQVNEAGASVYSASEVAREEFPDLDLTIRGAISIARRLQDPLAELVKIDPKSIGVGQYQHDVHQPLLARKLAEVVESCVNRVGVELATASAALLAHVAGIGPRLAHAIVAHREVHGVFRSRRELLRVNGLGPRSFEQAAGFLRLRDGEHPLDASAVHPERYALVERMASDLGAPLATLVGSAELAGRIDLRRYVGKDVGEPTLRDILAELERPGRDPRAAFEPPRFRDDVQTMEDLRAGMELEGVVTNVTAFGAFVDLGVHQDGLVHISELADRFVRDPHEVVRVGQTIQVRVLGVDLDRRRIALSARSGRR
ncbi:MAG: Tex family protein [Candidatus Eiseniibacteriota bacterium]|jgi:uncharacterized protein